jgi:DNA-binding NtrC family response regulator
LAAIANAVRAIPKSNFHSPAITLTEIRAEAELLRINEALHKHHNNRCRAAEELGISRMALYNKLHKYGLIRSGYRTHNE